jgi:hypothetical protein
MVSNQTWLGWSMADVLSGLKEIQQIQVMNWANYAPQLSKNLEEGHTNRLLMCS